MTVERLERIEMLLVDVLEELKFLGKILAEERAPRERPPWIGPDGLCRYKIVPHSETCTVDSAFDAVAGNG